MCKLYFAFARYVKCDPARGVLGKVAMGRIGLVLGRPIERDGNVYGAVVNLASRLCAAARPGQVIVDANLRKVAASRARFVTLDPLTLKGFAEPVPAFSLTPD